jgi:hypothetical protein
MKLRAGDSSREIDLLADAYRMFVEHQRRAATSPDDLSFVELTSTAYEKAISKRSLAVLRAGYAELIVLAKMASWYEEFLKEFEAKHGVSLLAIRGEKGPDARLKKVLERGSILTAADYRAVRARLDEIEADDPEEARQLTNLIELFDAANEK